jgi:hypothetical protein
MTDQPQTPFNASQLIEEDDEDTEVPFLINLHE